MRQKRQPRPRSTSSIPDDDDPIPIDLGDTARQIALFESGNGLQQGCGAILVAVVAALLLVPIRSFLRWVFAGNRRNRG